MAAAFESIESLQDRYLAGFESKAQDLLGALDRLSPPGGASPPGGVTEFRHRIESLAGSAEAYGQPDLAAWAAAGLGLLLRAAPDGAAPRAANLAPLRRHIEALAPLATRLRGGRRSAGPARASAPPSNPLERAAKLPSMPAVAPPAARSAAEPSAAGAAELSILLVDDDPQVHAAVRNALGSKRFLVTAAVGAAEGLAQCRRLTPDLLIVDTSLPGTDGLTLLAEIRRETQFEAIPAILLAPKGEGVDRTRAELLGVVDIVVKPFGSKSLADRVESIAASLSASKEVIDVGETTVEELTALLEREVRRGLAGAAEGPPAARINLVQAETLVATLWGAIAEVQDELVRLTEGRLSFRGVEHGRFGVLRLRDKAGSAAAATPGQQSELRGRLALVVDDDPSVRELFNAALGDAGMLVETADNGRAALKQMHATRPDVVIADIVMPQMGGWELCRRVRRDLSLRDIPVILLSWKEDYLQRMRELGAGATEYLLKETDRTQVHERVRAALKPRLDLEARLAESGDVSGRIEAVGLLTVLRAVARLRPDARLTVRENWNYFELVLREGRPVVAVRETTAGQSMGGAAAFDGLLAVDGGRFVVGAPSPSAAARSNLSGDLESLIASGCKRIEAMIDAIADGQLMRVGGVELDERNLDPYLRAAPERVRRMIVRLRSQQSPREILLSSGASPAELEAVLIDLVKRGAIVGVQVPAADGPPPPPPSADQKRWAALRGPAEPRAPSSAEAPRRVVEVSPPGKAAPREVDIAALPVVEVSGLLEITDEPGGQGAARRVGEVGLEPASASADTTAALADVLGEQEPRIEVDTSEVMEEEAPGAAAVDVSVVYAEDEDEMADTLEVPRGEFNAAMAAIDASPGLAQPNDVLFAGARASLGPAASARPSVAPRVSGPGARRAPEWKRFLVPTLMAALAVGIWAYIFWRQNTVVRPGHPANPPTPAEVATESMAPLLEPGGIPSLALPPAAPAPAPSPEPVVPAAVAPVRSGEPADRPVAPPPVRAPAPAPPVVPIVPSRAPDPFASPSSGPPAPAPPLPTTSSAGPLDTPPAPPGGGTGSGPLPPSGPSDAPPPPPPPPPPSASEVPAAPYESPTSSNGTLRIEPAPGGASPTVAVDGTEYGTPPITVTLRAGMHQIRYTLGATSAVRFVTLPAGGTRTVEAVDPR